MKRTDRTFTAAELYQRGLRSWITIHRVLTDLRGRGLDPDPPRQAGPSGLQQRPDAGRECGDVAAVPGDPARIHHGSVSVVQMHIARSCDPDPGFVGWARVVLNSGRGTWVERSGSERQATRHQMELRALVEGVAALSSEPVARTDTGAPVLRS